MQKVLLPKKSKRRDMLRVFFFYKFTNLEPIAQRFDFNLTDYSAQLYTDVQTVRNFLCHYTLPDINSPTKHFLVTKTGKSYSFSGKV